MIGRSLEECDFRVDRQASIRPILYEKCQRSVAKLKISQGAHTTTLSIQLSSSNMATLGTESLRANSASHNSYTVLFRPGIPSSP